MNSLTIPDLNLFNNNRRMSPTKRDYLYSTSDRKAITDYQSITRKAYNPRDDLSLLNTVDPTRTLFSQTRYKQIAQNYLQQQGKFPSYPIQPYPYLYSIPSYPYPELSRRELPCQYQVQNLQKDLIKTKKLHHHNYLGIKEQPIRHPIIVKQPYLETTFREKKTTKNKDFNMKGNNNQGGSSKIIEKLKTNQSKDEQQPKIGPINSLMIASKHEASIQTDLKPQITSSKTKIQSKQSKTTFQRILEQQNLLIESMNIEFQRQNDFKFHFQDLQNTKNDFMDKSRELLLKLNQLADDKRDFALISKAFTPYNSKHNVFGSSQV